MIRDYGILAPLRSTTSVHKKVVNAFDRGKKILLDGGIVHTCIICGAPVADLHHNVTRLRDGELVANPTNLYPVCRRCHNKLGDGWLDEHGIFRRWSIVDDIVYELDGTVVANIKADHAEFVRLWKENV